MADEAQHYGSEHGRIRLGDMLLCDIATVVCERRRSIGAGRGAVPGKSKLVRLWVRYQSVYSICS